MNGLAFQIARRELSGGTKGFWIYLACLALGAFAIAAAGTVTDSFNRGLVAQQRTLLGGDIRFTFAQRRATVEERQWMDERGTVSERVSLNVMGEALGKRRQVDLRAVDDQHPLIGAPILSLGATSLDTALEKKNGVWGAAVSASTLEHFDLSIGDEITLGPLNVEIRTRLDRSADGLGTEGTFGPSALVRIEALIEAGRLSNGQLFRASYRMVRAPASENSIDEISTAAQESWADAGMRVRLPADAVDGLQNLLAMLNSFLSVIGVAALVAGGVGVAQATSSFLETRIASIAAFKALGADIGLIRASYALQLGGLAALGAMTGALLGAAAPLALQVFAGDRIPLPQILSFDLLPLARAFLLSILSAILFAAPSLGRAVASSPSLLFRRLSADQVTPMPRLEKFLAPIAGISLFAFAAISSTRPMVTLMLLVGAAIAYFLFLGVAVLIRRTAKALSGRFSGIQRLAFSNLGGPGSLAPTVAPALGLGLALLTLVAVVQQNILKQVQETAPANVPSLVFSQIPGDGFEKFDLILASTGIDINDPDIFRRAPQMLGRVISLNGSEIVEEEVAESERWVVQGEIGLTYLAAKPPEAELTKGRWWAEDYRGPLLASVEHEAAKGLGLDVGDSIGFRIFGREVVAEVASLRRVDWGGFGANTAVILSPGTLEAARPSHFAIAKASRAKEETIIALLGEQLPDVVVFQTSAFLAIAARLLGDISIAINAAAGIVTVAGLLVLMGAFASITRKRRGEAALLKTFGASKASILGLYASEFAIVGASAAFIGSVIGVGAAWPVVVNVFEAEWHIPWMTIGIVFGTAIFAAGIGGAISGFFALSPPPARVLRESK